MDFGFFFITKLGKTYKIFNYPQLIFVKSPTFKSQSSLYFCCAAFATDSSRTLLSSFLGWLLLTKKIYKKKKSLDVARWTRKNVISVTGSERQRKRDGRRAGCKRDGQRDSETQTWQKIVFTTNEAEKCY